MEARRDVFQAISDPTRREIIHILAYESMNLNRVAEHFDISRPAVSRHIKILNECGLVVIHKKGRERYCRTNPASLIEVWEWINRYRRFWSQKLDLLEAALLKEDIPKPNSKDIYNEYKETTDGRNANADQNHER